MISVSVCKTECDTDVILKTSILATFSFPLPGLSFLNVEHSVAVTKFLDWKQWAADKLDLTSYRLIQVTTFYQDGPLTNVL